MDKPTANEPTIIGPSALAEIADREWRLESVLEAARIGTWEWNVQSNEVSYDGHWSDILGYDIDQMASADSPGWEHLIHPDDRERMHRLLDEHIAGKSPYYECDLRMRHKDGHWVWVLDRGRMVIRLKSGVPLLMFGAVSDISDRKRAEDELRLSEDRFRLSLDMASDAIYLVSEDRCFYANSAGLALLGAAELSDIAASDYLDRVVPDCRPKMIELVRNVRAGLGQQRIEMQLTRLDGSIVDVECSGTLIPIGTERITELVARDIGGRKRAEAALRHSHDLMQYVIEHDRSAVAVHDRDLNYIFVSQRYLEEYGVQEKDIIGRHHYDVFPDLPEKWREVHQKALNGTVSSAENDPYQREDGTMHWTRWECRPWYEADGAIGGIVVYTEVIDEQKQAEERLVQYQKRLRALAAELVVSAEREQRRLATDLHDGVGQLLVAAKMEAQLLGGETRDGKSDARVERLIQLLSNSIEEVRSLTAQLAPTVLIGRGLAGSLRWLADRFHELYGLSCVVRVDKSAESQGIDTKMLIFRIVREALNNVARHSGADHAVVTVRHLPNRVSISITDRGVGFEAAQQDDLIISRRFGLFSINEECLARGGSLLVWSEPGHGTRVTAWLPDVLETVSLD